YARRVLDLAANSVDELSLNAKKKEEKELGTIDYLPKKIESPTYEKRSQIELNQVTLQRHNDSRVGISPPSEPDVKVSPHPALCRVPEGSSLLPLISSLYHIMGVYRRSQRLARKGCYTIPFD
ncbi:transcription termination/antitermination protein NusA, partial [Striga asiatica]